MDLSGTACLILLLLNNLSIDGTIKNIKKKKCCNFIVNLQW